MKQHTSFVVLALVLSLVLAATPAWGAGGGVAAVKKPQPETNPDFGGPNDPNNIVDRLEPWNNNCATAEAWRGRMRDTSNGRVTPGDPADWSMAKLYRTETLTPSVTHGVAEVRYAEYCGGSLTSGSLMSVAQSGPYYLRVSPARGVASGYSVHYEITPNDASVTGLDVGNSPFEAYMLSVMPSTGDPRERITLSGALPNRPDQTGGSDEDWFLVTPGLPSVSTPGDCLDVPHCQPPHITANIGPNSLSVGLLTITFAPDCDTGGLYRLTVYQSDGATPIGSTTPACGAMKISCVALSFGGASRVYARTQIDAPGPGSPGAGYDLTPDLSPLYAINYDNGHVTLPNPNEPWCNPLVPLALSITNPGASLVDEAGHVVARVPGSFLEALAG